LLGELAQPPLKVVRVAEKIAESTAFHAANGSHLREHRPAAAAGTRGGHRIRLRGPGRARTLAAQPMTADEQLIYQARVRPRQAVVAGVAAASLLIASITQLVGPHSHVNELTIGLITEHKRVGLDLAGACVQGIGSLALAWTLVFLFGATKARNPRLPGA